MHSFHYMQSLEGKVLYTVYYVIFVKVYTKPAV